MRNSPRQSGVYSNMLRAPLFLIASITLLAQQSPRLEPLDAQLQSVWVAENQRDFDGAATAPRAGAFPVAAHAGRFAALCRLGPAGAATLPDRRPQRGRAGNCPGCGRSQRQPLGDTHPDSHRDCSICLDVSWRQDGSLLKAVACLERVAAAQAALRPAATGRNDARPNRHDGGHSFFAWECLQRR